MDFDDAQAWHEAYDSALRLLVEERTAADTLGYGAEISARVKELRAVYKRVVKVCQELEGTLASVPASVLEGWDVRVVNMFRRGGPIIIHDNEVVYLIGDKKESDHG